MLSTIDSHTRMNSQMLREVGGFRESLPTAFKMAFVRTLLSVLGTFFAEHVSIHFTYVKLQKLRENLQPILDFQSYCRGEYD
jgi:hypothetical protein